MTRSRKKRNTGMTLIELLIAAAILAVTLTTLLGFFVNVLSLNGMNRDFYLAESHADTILEDIRDHASTSAYTALKTNIRNGEWAWDAETMIDDDMEVLYSAHLNSTPNAQIIPPLLVSEIS